MFKKSIIDNTPVSHVIFTYVHIIRTIILSDETAGLSINIVALLVGLFVRLKMVHPLKYQNRSQTCMISLTFSWYKARVRVGETVKMVEHCLTLDS